MAAARRPRTAQSSRTKSTKNDSGRRDPELRERHREPGDSDHEAYKRVRRELLVLPSKHLLKCLNFAETCSGLKAMRDTEDRAKLQRRLRTMLVCLRKDLVVYYRNDRLMKLALHGNAKKARQNQVALINDCEGVVLPFAPMTAIHHIPPGRLWRRGGRHRPPGRVQFGS